MATIRLALVLSFLDKYSALIINVGANLALARILTPFDVGLYSIAASFVGFASSLRDFGIGSYLLQEKELTTIRQRSALGVAILITWTTGAILAACSSMLATYYGEPRVRDIILVLSINFVFVPFTMIVINLLRREMRFGALYRVGLITTIFRSGVAVTFGLLGWGFMALAWSSVAGLIATLITTQFELPAAGRLVPSLREWRHIVTFGALSTLGQLMVELGAAAPNIIIGRVISPTAVGLYSRAFGMVTLFSQAILEGLSPVAVSAVAMRHREGTEVRTLWLRGLSYISAFGWPFFSFIAIMTFPVIRILFGDQWDAAVPLARLICIAAMIGLIDAMSWPTLQGTGSVGKYALVQVFTMPIQVIALAAALLYERDIVAAGWVAIFASLLHVCASLGFLRRLLDIRLRNVVEALAKSAALTLITSAGPALVTIILPLNTNGLWEVVLLGVASSSLGFVGGIFLLRHPVAEEMKGMLSRSLRVVTG